MCLYSKGYHKLFELLQKGGATASLFCLYRIMANEQNLKPITSSEEARAKQKKSVEKRYENKIRKGLIADAILDALSEEDLREIARGMIDRAKENSSDLIAMRDTIGEKPVEKHEVKLNEDTTLDRLREDFPLHEA